MRLALVCVALFAAGCWQKTTPTKDPVNVNIESLFRSYRDYPDIASSAWTDHRIRVVLAPRDYQAKPDGVHWHEKRDAPAVFLFMTDRPPLDNSRTIEIIGVCRGRQHDGILRSPSVDWHVRCEECVITALP